MESLHRYVAVYTSRYTESRTFPEKFLSNLVPDYSTIYAFGITCYFFMLAGSIGFYNGKFLSHSDIHQFRMAAGLSANHE